MSLTVKAFLEKNNPPGEEIRRFAIPGDVTTSHAYLSKKIAEIFPSLKEGNFFLYWKDPDGDMVLFSTDEEQLEALAFVTDSLFKVYIKLKAEDKQDAQAPEKSEGELHPGVVCDGCDGSIRGLRFKCLSCPDYDLCSACETKGIHTQHNMMKLTTSSGFHPPPGHFWGFAPPPPPPPHMHGPRHGPHGHSRPGEPFAPPPHFRRWMKKFMKRWHNKNAPGCSHDLNGDSPDDEDANCEYLNSVGDSVAAMLDPMGIDVTVDVEHGGKRHCRVPGQGRGRGKGHGGCGFMQRDEKLKRKCPRMGGRAGKMADKAADKNGDKDDEKSGDSTDELSEKTRMIVIDDEKETENQASKQAERKDEEVIMIRETENQPEETAPKMNVQSGSHDTTDSTWTLVSPPPQTSQPAPAPPARAPAPATAQAAPVPTLAHQAERSVQFQMPPQLVYPPSSPQVAEALNQMLAMGFNNDNGWLTRLLEAKNGDIIQVLDAIKPQPGRNREANGGYMA